MKRKVKRKKLKSLRSLHSQAWNLWSEIVRRKAKGICYTCNRQSDWRECHAGHFRHNKLDFDEMNVHCQCAGCNTFKHGNLGIYALKLCKEYGNEAVDDLILRSNQINKISRDGYEILINRLKRELNDQITTN